MTSPIFQQFTVDNEAGTISFVDDKNITWQAEWNEEGPERLDEWPAFLQSRCFISEEGLAATEDGEVICQFMPVVPDEGLTQDQVDQILRWFMRYDAVVASSNATAKEAFESMTEIHNRHFEKLNQDGEYLFAKTLHQNAKERSEKASKRSTDLLNSYGPLLRNFVQKALGDAKSRTWKSDFGSISLRTQPEVVEIVDEEEGIRWLEANGGESAIVKSIGKSLLTNEIKNKIAVLQPDSFRLNRAPDKVSITTGVKKAVKG